MPALEYPPAELFVVYIDIAIDRDLARLRSLYRELPRALYWLFDGTAKYAFLLLVQ